MENAAQKLKTAREKLNISIEEASEKTKIRPHILKALEAGNFDIMSPIYVKSFLKTYSKFLKIDEIDLNAVNEAKKDKTNLEDTPVAESKPKKDYSEPDIPVKIFKEENEEVKKKSPNKSRMSFSDDSIETEKTNFAEIFNTKKVKTISKANYVNIAIYSLVFIALLLSLYFTFFYNSNSTETAKEDTKAIGADTAVIKPQKNILSYFEESDSLLLEAVAIDTAWIRIEIDGTKSEEILMKPEMEMKWKAGEYFLINQGNVGAVNFKRNGELLEPFGNRGTVVRNVKITRNEVLNTIKIDENRTNKKTYKTRKKTNKKKTPRLIEPSEIAKPEKIINEENSEEPQ